MKTRLAYLIILLVLTSVAFGKYSGGTGEPNDPYLIATPNDLNSIGLDSNDWDKHFLMTADINLADFTGTQFNIIGKPGNAFCGVFDGNGHTVSNFTWSSTGEDFIGLFGYVAGIRFMGIVIGGEIKNLGLINPNISIGTGDDASGCGGLVGCLHEATISNCYAQCARVSATGWRIGGLVGYNNGGVVINCYATGNIDGNGNIGGIVGYNYIDGEISNCYAESTVSGIYAIGGLVGNNFGMITNCYAKGSVLSTSDSAGGLVGCNTNVGAISHCYATGDVSGNYDIGGLVGHHFNGSYTECFWDNTVNSGLDGIGNGSDPNVIGKSTTEMKKENTFTDAGWDFVEIWNIGENQTYPFLRTHLPGDINKDDKTDFYDLAIVAENWLKEE